MLLKKLTLLFSICLWMVASPMFAQKNAQAYTDSRSSTSTSIFTPKEGKSAKKRSKVKRSKKGYNSKSGLFSKKKKSDCDCPGSPKAQRKKRKR